MQPFPPRAQQAQIAGVHEDTKQATRPERATRPNQAMRPKRIKRSKRPERLKGTQRLKRARRLSRDVERNLAAAVEVVREARQWQREQADVDWSEPGAQRRPGPRRDPAA